MNQRIEADRRRYGGRPKKLQRILACQCATPFAWIMPKHCRWNQASRRLCKPPERLPHQISCTDDSAEGATYDRVSCCWAGGGVENHEVSILLWGFNQTAPES